MRRVDQAPQVVGPPVAAGRGEQGDTVVAPVARPGKVGHRHELDGRDAEIAQIRQPVDDAREASRGVKVPTCSS